MINKETRTDKLTTPGQEDRLVISRVPDSQRISSKRYAEIYKNKPTIWFYLLMGWAILTLWFILMELSHG